MKSNEQHVDASKSKNNNNSLKFNSKVSNSFKQLTKENKLERINGAINLLQHLNVNRDNDEDEDDKKRVHSLRRLVRGLGASTSNSRTGFYTTLVAVLSSIPSHNSTDGDILRISNVFEMMDTVLSVGTTGRIEKEESDALIGQILVCAAVLHSNKLFEATADEISKCVQTLINASHHKLFHSSLAYTFLLELLDKLTETQFVNIMWPLMRKELKRPWEKQNINTVQFVIECQSKYPTLVDDGFLQSSLTTNEILTPLSFKHLSRLFWSPKTIMNAATHPSYETFGRYLAGSVSRKVLLQFWHSEISEILLAPTKLKEVVTLRLLTVIFSEKKIAHKTAVTLLSDSFVKLLTKSLKSYKQQKVEYIEAFYNEFFESIENYMESLGSNDDAELAKVALIQRFICRPGTLLIEKYTPNRIVHRFVGKLSANGVKMLFELYKNILFEKIAKNPTDKTDGWLHVEKEHCVQMLQTLLNQKMVQGETEWRTEQLKLLLKLSLFYVNKENEAIVAKERDSDVLPKDLANKVKQTFYTSLQMKMQRLDDEKNTLLSIVKYCNDNLCGKSVSKTLRYPLSEKALQSWQKMFQKVTAKTKNSKLNTVFNVLLMHMGLQLFADAKMAQEAIDDLEKCMERTHKKLKAKSDAANEPEWIEVVVDLFLHLMSQNTSFLRNIVDNVFPQLCDSLNLTAVHQILSMLDMKEKNPLSPNEAVDDEGNDSESDSSENETSSDESDESDNENNEDADSEDVEDIDEVDEDEGTVTDQLRSVISGALGAAVPETDTESVDLNEMDDAEAERLDAALSDAFKLIREKSSGSGSKKKTKLERITNTTVMHFRIRVLDLIDIYLKTNPSLVITLEILLTLVGMSEHCSANKDLKPLSNRLDRVLKTLLALRQFASVDDVTDANLAELLNSLVNGKVNPSAVDKFNEVISRCCVFLISASQLLQSKKQSLFELITEYLEQFLKTRNPKVSFNCFQNIMKIRWVGIWRMGETLTKIGLLAKNDARAFRRTQAIELLSIIYKNHGFIVQDIDKFNTINRPIQTGIEEYVAWLQQEEHISPKEFSVLLNLLQDIHKCTQTISQYKCTVNWQQICEHIQTIRQKTILLSYPMYQSFCKRFNIQPIKNNELDVLKKKSVNRSNGHDETGITTTLKLTNGVAKRKADDADSSQSKKSNAKKLKKLKKEERLKIASIGFDGTSFKLGVNHDDVNDAVTDENTDIDENMEDSEVDSDSD